VRERKERENDTEKISENNGTGGGKIPKETGRGDGQSLEEKSSLKTKS